MAKEKKTKNKLKTRKSISRRFKVTRTGKVLHERGFSSHLKAKKSASRKRRLRRMKKTEGKVAIKIKKALGKSVK